MFHSVRYVAVTGLARYAVGHLSHHVEVGGGEEGTENRQRLLPRHQSLVVHTYRGVSEEGRTVQGGLSSS